MNNIKVLYLLDKAEWNQYVHKLTLDYQDIYFTPEYYSLYERNKEGTAQCFVFERDGEIAIYPFLLNSINELGYELAEEFYDIQGAYGYNGIISTNYTNDFINDFYKVFNEYCFTNNIIAEFTRFHPLLKNQLFSENHFDIYLDRNTISLDLSQNYDNIWKNEYSGNNRNMIRKAERMGVRSYISQDESDYRQFIELYKETMKNVNAADYYYFSEEYFNNMRSGLGKNFHLIVSKVDDEFAGGMLLFTYGDYAHYHLSGRKIEFGKHAVNNHFLDHAIKTAIEAGCKKFHFGGGTTADSNDSLLKFKANFSQQKSLFYFGKKIHNKEVYAEIIKQWQEKHPTSHLQNNNKLLGYREI